MYQYGNKSTFNKPTLVSEVNKNTLIALGTSSILKIMGFKKISSIYYIRRLKNILFMNRNFPKLQDIRKNFGKILLTYIEFLGVPAK